LDSQFVLIQVADGSIFVYVRKPAKEFAMKCALAAFLAVSLGTILLSAQSANQQRGASIIFTPQSTAQPAISYAMPSSTCPVSLRAGHLSDGNLVRTGTAHPKGIGQWLSLSLTSPDEKQITRARLTVHGLTPKGHMSQTRSVGTASLDAEQTFTVEFSPGRQSIAVANLWVPGMSAVERIDVQSVDYHDGSTWKLADGQSCQVKPDLFMLVASQ
jgi:hypothetical protein